MALRQRLHKVIFESDTRAGKRFDVFLLWIILFSVLIVMLDSVAEIGQRYSDIFFVTEWVLTVIFSIEYGLRIWISPRRLKYLFSFWGFIDLLSILPSYLSLVLAGYHYMLVVRIFRLLRVFRILKLARFNTEAQILIEALRASVYKISIFFMAVLAIVTFMGTTIYVVEGGREGFSSIPQSIYWAIVTVTTVGYGDIVPHTVMGKFLSSIAMITGYVFIAVPTGIVTLEISRSALKKKECSACNSKNEIAANYCAQCGRLMG
ncbi:ion transporter [bacterium]|nr:ion transporter [bacterium]